MNSGRDNQDVEGEQVAKLHHPRLRNSLESLLVALGLDALVEHVTVVLIFFL